MINQRQAAKEEQQRIKNLVLNLDLRENEEIDGEDDLTPYKPYTSIHQKVYRTREARLAPSSQPA